MTSGGNEALSGILGWMSIACWIVVYSPQLVENYQLKSGEGISILFVYIWAAGDIANLFGAVLAGLLPTIIILAIYYTTCDIALLTQIYYYRWLRASRTGPLILDVEGHPSVPSEETPLIADVQSSGEDRKTSKSIWREFVVWGGALAFVLGTGAISWALDQYVHRNQPREPPKEVFEWKSQVLGWISAILYLGARIPQILKNFQTKCAGLSFALFIFSIAGNTTYALSILAASLDPGHIAANASWLAGSGLTVFLDIFVLIQFFYYRAAEARGTSRGL
ncbi:PQ-loop-domain-containing protein [Irpex rosettiformis]|uniref:PQ-loop-domain-containing protein n=1 Tax=Irpex rosettiformis TaxID=378272 RepID=A0ACB8U0E1_9APHY|nr:PQ-loop-domain-containing protein [Irpex rosettiformis]